VSMSVSATSVSVSITYYLTCLKLLKLSPSAGACYGPTSKMLSCRSVAKPNPKYCKYFAVPW
jgi:hypothetical protein